MHTYMKETAMTNNTNNAECTSCAPDAQELENLGPGCYVQVKDGESCYWVEITEMAGDDFSGVLHCELGGSDCVPTAKTKSIGQFTKNQIVNLGCDNYCWC